uniref:Protein CIP2A n=1 Tax=Anthurium amnicola TaxID=1678845 RepID=A0A1D1Z342_9ARAE
MSISTSDIRDKIIESIRHFSEINQLEVKDDFIQNKLGQIFNQEEKFRKFADDYDQRLSTHADDLITFAEFCEEDNISSDELLASLKKLSDAKLNKSKSELINQLEDIKKYLEEIINEIIDYDEKIANKQTDFNNKINRVDKNTNEAISFAKGSVFIVGIAAIASAPFTAGVSLALLPAKLIVAVSTNLIVHGAATAVVSSVVAGVSSIQSKKLNYDLQGVREQISRLLQELQKGLEDINTIIAHCDSHFEEQISEIEEVEKIVDIFKKLDDRNGRQLIKPIARSISSRARKNSESYGMNMRQVLKRDSGYFDLYVCAD